MKRTRAASGKASKPAATKKAHKGPGQASSGGKDDLGVSEAQLERIADRVGQKLAQSVAAEVVSALSGAGNAAPHPVPQPALPTDCPGPSAPIPVDNPQATQREHEVAETTVRALVYGESGSKPSSVLCTSSTPLAFHVNDKLQEKIKTNRFVDFKHLLPGNGDTSYTLRLDGAHGEPAVHLASTTPSKPIPDMDTWLSAFTSYQFVYLQAHPSCAPELLKYMDTIRDINRRFGFAAAKSYDENFRLLRERSPDLSFGCTHTELWLKAATLQPLSRPSNQPFLARPATSRPRQGNSTPGHGTCFDYNARDKRCVLYPCKYRHVCSQCQGSHPQFRCQTGAKAHQAGGGRQARAPAAQGSPSANTGKPR